MLLSENPNFQVQIFPFCCTESYTYVLQREYTNKTFRVFQELYNNIE